MMPAERGELAGIVDIEFGPPVVADPPWLMPTVIIIGLLLIIAVLVWWWRSKRGRGLRRLRRQQWHRDTLSNRRAAFQLAAVLQSTLGLSALSPDTPLPPRLQTQQPRWRDFNRRLANARYVRPEPGNEEVDQLLREARYWLRQWLGYRQ